MVEIIILALVQGITEFLPVSSSGHLLIIPKMLGWKDFGLGFSAVLHLGTLLAILLYFRHDWILLIQSILQPKNKIRDKERRLVTLIIIATFPGAIAGFFFSDFLETAFRNPLGVSIFITLGSIILWWSEYTMRSNVSLNRLGKKAAIGIGIAQAISLFPGVSRSGMTMAMGMLCGVSRSDAARFSFLMAAPITAGASFFSFPELIKLGFTTEAIIAVVVSFVSAYMIIGLFLKWIELVKYRVFVWYGFILAVFSFLFL